jgi:hypothetical protein
MSVHQHVSYSKQRILIAYDVEGSYEDMSDECSCIIIPTVNRTQTDVLSNFLKMAQPTKLV